MNQFEQGPKMTQEMTSSHLLRLGVLIALIGAAVVTVSWYLYRPSGQTTSTLTPEQYQARQESWSIAHAARAGDFAQAMEMYSEIANSPIPNPEKEAYAVLSTAAIPYRMTGDEKLVVAHIPKLKEVIEDQSVSLNTRVAAINTLASSYCGSGRTWEVFEEIYKGEPYSQFLVPNNPDKSSRNMFEWSYSLMPTSDAAIFLGRSHVFSAYARFKQTGVRDQVFRADVTKAVEYIRAADALVQKNIEFDGQEYLNSQRYAVYLYWRALSMAIGGYTSDEGSEAHTIYSERYKVSYDDFFAKYAAKQDEITYKYVPFARMHYGYFLMKLENNEEMAREQFEQIQAFVESDENFNTNPFVRWVRNERSLRENGTRQGVFSDSLDTGKELSPKFAAFVDSIR